MWVYVHVCMNACEYVHKCACDVYLGACLTYLYMPVLVLFPCVCTCEEYRRVNVACMNVCVHESLYEFCACARVHVHR